MSTYNKPCATSENLDQPANPHKLIRDLADCLCLSQPPGYPKRDKREPFSYWVDVETDLSLCCLHRYYCSFFHALTHICHRYIFFFHGASYILKLSIYICGYWLNRRNTQPFFFQRRLIQKKQIVSQHEKAYLRTCAPRKYSVKLLYNQVM